MIKISLQIESFHPAIESALAGRNIDAVLSAVNDVVGDATEVHGAVTGNVRSKENKKEITVSASGKISGVKLPKDSPAAHLARCHWYLSGSKDYYMRIETVALPLSVREWIAGKQFDLVSAVA